MELAKALVCADPDAVKGKISHRSHNTVVTATTSMTRGMQMYVEQHSLCSGQVLLENNQQLKHFRTVSRDLLAVKWKIDHFIIQHSYVICFSDADVATDVALCILLRVHTQGKYVEKFEVFFVCYQNVFFRA